MTWFRMLTCIVLTAAVFAQQTTIRTTVPLVQAPVSITDKSGHFVHGLTQDDFVVLDEGRQVPVHVDDPDTVSAPLALIVLVQVTDISQAALLKIKKVGSMISQAVAGANAVAAAITYSDQVAIAQPFTSDADALSDIFQDLKAAPTRNGHMLDALAQAIELLDHRPPGARSAILIIGEGKDRGSKTGLAAVLTALQKSGATVYCIEYSAFLTPFTTSASEYTPPAGGGGWILDSIAETAHAMKKDTGKILTASSGGRALKFETKSKLENDLIRLGTEIHSRYIISFAPTGSPPEGFHRITVQVRNRPDLAVRARPGYWPVIQ